AFTTRKGNCGVKDLFAIGADSSPHKALVTCSLEALMNRISILILAGAATLVSATAASAADLLINQPAPVYGNNFGSSTGGWDVAYVCGGVGCGWGTTVDEDGNVLLKPDAETDLSGWTVGAKLGANFSVGGGLVLGAEGDVAWSGIGGYNNDALVDYDINWT